MVAIRDSGAIMTLASSIVIACFFLRTCYLHLTRQKNNTFKKFADVRQVGVFMSRAALIRELR